MGCGINCAFYAIVHSQVPPVLLRVSRRRHVPPGPEMIAQELQPPPLGSGLSAFESEFQNNRTTQGVVSLPNSIKQFEGVMVYCVLSAPAINGAAGRWSRCDICSCVW